MTEKFGKSPEFSLPGIEVLPTRQEFYFKGFITENHELYFDIRSV